MLQTDRILIATDFSGPAERARRQAEHLAAVHDAALHVLHVTGDAELAEFFDALPEDKVTARRAQAYLAEWLGRPIEPPSAAREDDAHLDDQGETVPEETWTVRRGGSPAEGILAYAEEIDANLLVLGAETQSQPLGGVTDAVVRRARRPVITVPPRADEAEDAPRIPRDLPRETLKRLQVAVDGTESASLLLEHARILAAANGASVDLVRVPRPSSITNALSMTWGRPEGAPRVSSRRENELDRFAKQLQRAGIPARSRVLSGNPASAITRYAEKRRMDLILMGAHAQRGLPQTVLGSVAERVIRTAPCPVATFKGDAQTLLSGEGRPAINWDRRKQFGIPPYRSDAS